MKMSFSLSMLLSAAYWTTSALRWLARGDMHHARTTARFSREDRQMWCERTLLLNRTGTVRTTPQAFSS